MNNKINLSYVFFAIGIVNLIFLFDTMFTNPMEGFSIFSIKTSKTLNLFYYFLVFIILMGAGIYNFRRAHCNKRKLE